MLPLDADPALLELAAAHDDLVRTRRALRADLRRLGAAAPGVAPSTPLPDELRPAAAACDALLAVRDALLADPAIRPLANDALDRRAAVLRTVVHAVRAERLDARRSDERAGIIARAVSSGRELAPHERERVAELDAAAPDRSWEQQLANPAMRDAVLAELGRLRLRTARSQLRSGLLRTEQMRSIIEEALPALRRGAPMLLIGETGGAKTALAEAIARDELGREPELVSGYGDISSAQLIGAHELRAEGGATVSVFVPGPLLRAMTEGRVLILDEMNAMPPEFLKRLNRILQLRPGDRYAVQEHAGDTVEISPGFAIIATANEQSGHRYRGIDRLSAELVNRFGANAYRVHYPDCAAATGSDQAAAPRENLLLAAAAVCDEDGRLPDALPLAQLEAVARAAFISQQVFSGRTDSGFERYVSTEREVDGRPGLEESVLAPRTLVAILEKVAGSAGTVSLEHALRRFVEGVMHREDRAVLTLIIEGQGFRLS